MADARITTEMLRTRGACPDQLELFAKLFPTGSPPSREEALAAALEHAGGFDWGWAAVFLLDRARGVSYGELEAAAWAIYNTARKALYEDCLLKQEGLSPKRAAAVLGHYHVKREVHAAAYARARAAAFVELWFEQNA